MNRDFFAIVLVAVAFASLTTTHLMLAVGLTRRHPRWLAPLAFAVPPLAPLLGWRAGLRVRSGLWTLTALAYAAAFWFGCR